LDNFWKTPQSKKHFSSLKLVTCGSGLHKLSGKLADFYAVKVSGNYRIIFRLEEGVFHDVDYVDYH